MFTDHHLSILNPHTNMITANSSIIEVYDHIKNLKLTDHSFADVADNFKTECIDGKVFLNLLKSELNSLGIFQMTRRNLLFKHIVDLRKQAGNKNYDEPVNVTANNQQNLLLSMNQIQQPLTFPLNFPIPLSPTKVHNMGTLTVPNYNIFSPRPNNLLLSPMHNHLPPPPSQTLLLSPTSLMISQSLKSAPNTMPNMMHPTSFPLPSAFDTLAAASNAQWITTNQASIQSMIKPKRLFVEPYQSMPTEECQYDCKQVAKDTIKFVGVFRGINSLGQIFLLMSKQHIGQFNDIAIKWSNTTQVLPSSTSGNSASEFELVKKSDKNEGVQPNDVDELMAHRNENLIVHPRNFYCCTTSSEQVFLSKLTINKLSNGWNLNGEFMPFNALCVFTFDFVKNELVSMAAMEVDGVVNNVDHRGLTWIACALKIDAVENREDIHCHLNAVNGKCGSIQEIKILDNRKNQFNTRDVSYLIHERVDAEHFARKKGDKVKCCMKLSTRTNSKWKQRKRPVFIQTWNVRAAEECNLMNREQ